MVMRRFVEASGKNSGYGYVGPDRIPGTNKVRTYVTGAWLYSKESDLETIIRRRRETVGTNYKTKEKILKKTYR